MTRWIRGQSARWVAISLATVASTGLMGGCPFLGSTDTTPIFETSAVVKWNEVMLAAVRNGSPRPTVVARSSFIVQNSVYDAWAQYDGTANGVITRNLRRPASERTDANKEKAISFAAYKALLDQFPAYEVQFGAFTRLLTDLGYDPADAASTDTTKPEGIGNVCAQAVLDFRQSDGSNESNNYPSSSTNDTFPTTYSPVNCADDAAACGVNGADFDLNRWQPLRVPTGKLTNSSGRPIFDPTIPSSFTDQTFLTPHWGGVIPFALSAYNQFPMTGPPVAGSSDPYTDPIGRSGTNDEIYNLHVDEVLDISANLTDREKVIAEFWADGPRSESPPGHWQAIAHGISFRDQNSLDDDVKLYFALSGAVFDSSIAVWGYKRQFDSIRPASAIRHKYFGQMVQAWGGPNLGTQTIMGEDWNPYQDPTFVTPPFGEYPSGHSCFSAASAEVLKEFTGSDQFYDGTTILFDDDFNNDGIPDLLGQHIVGAGKNRFEASPSAPVILTWNTFSEAADEAGISRLYGGIHFVSGDRDSRVLGRLVGAQAFARAQEYWTGAR